MRALAPDFAPYAWAASTAEVARIAGIDQSQVLRFDQNTPPLPLPSSRMGMIAGAVARVSGYPGSTYPPLVEAISRYAGVEPENGVLGAGADDLILLCARAWAGPGDEVAIPPRPTYALYRIAAQLVGAQITDGYLPAAALTFACRPNNPTGTLDDLPDARPLIVDEAYFEFAGETALPLIEDGEVVVLRTFSKSFALAGARVGYALAAADVAAELNARQAPAPISSLSAELATAALANPPDVGPTVAERDRLASALRAIGLEPLPSSTNFLYVPVEDGLALGDALLRRGLVVRAYEGAIRASVRDAEDDDLLVETLARIFERPSPVAAAGGRRSRILRATAETRLAARLALDGAGRVRVSTGAGLYDHLLEQLAFHAELDLVLEGSGDLETGEHNTAADAAIAPRPGA
jgi:histidinol-phosphate/aromatic aminotransferase/cobyric acid decarboxylase-like protein